MKRNNHSKQAASNETRRDEKNDKRRKGSKKARVSRGGEFIEWQWTKHVGAEHSTQANAGRRCEEGTETVRDSGRARNGK